MPTTKNNPKTQAFYQLLLSTNNKKLAEDCREKASLPRSGIYYKKDTKKFNNKSIAKNFGIYRMFLIKNNPQYFDILSSQEENIDTFLYQYFVFGIASDEIITKIQLTGCEIFSISEPIDIPNSKAFLPNGVYIKIGTNNTIKNVKDFINKNSEKIRNSQRKLSKEKPIRLIPSKTSLRDLFIVNFYKKSQNDLLEIAKISGFEETVRKIIETKGIEKKEKIIQAFVLSAFKEKIELGLIRKIVSVKSK